MKPLVRLGIACFTAGAAIGALLVGRAVGQRGAAATAPALIEARPTSAPAAEAVMRVDRPPLKAPSSYRDRFAALTALNSVLKAKIHVSLLAGETVSDDFARLYGLTAAEVSQLNSCFAKAKEKLADLEASRAVFDATGNDSVTIKIAPFPKEGGAVYDELGHGIRSVLGDERYAFYRKDASEFQSTLFDRFGLSDKTITIHPPPPGETPSPRFSTRFEGDVLVIDVQINPQDFVKQYPAIYRRMLATGVWSYAVKP